jgi:rhomboid protease GluP
MDGEIDFTNYSEAELLEVWGRIDPRSAPINCARLKELLVERGYIVQDGTLLPGTATPSPAKLEALIGSDRPISCEVTFGETCGLFGWLEPAHNAFGLVGSGTLTADGVHVWLSGRRAGLFGSVFKRNVEFTWNGISDVESDGNVVHFTYRAYLATEGAITLWFSDQAAAQRLAAVLPKERSAEFHPQLQPRVEFDRNLILQSRHTPMTVGLVTLNTLVFLATVLAGAGWFVPHGSVQVAWGSNFGPFTSDGEWWRLLTSLFIHFGVIHLAFNMWALATFGPMTERLYGSMNFLLIYLAAGITGSLASISWRPDINSAGASGAIFGILGALLAAHLRNRKTMPGGVLHPLRNSTLIFVGYALLNSFTTTGIDVAAHLGGLTAGCLIGWVAARPIVGKTSLTRTDLRSFLQMIPLAVLFLAGGLWCAQRASTSLVGDGLYWHTFHWFRAGERAANDHFNAALRLNAVGSLTQVGFAEQLDHDVLPFWKDASDRFAAIQLAPGSPNISRLQLLQTFSDGRVAGYELLASGLHRNDAKEISNAGAKLAQVEKLIEK